MPSAHPVELRERVVHAYLSGEGTFPEIADRFSVGEASVSRWVQSARKGVTAPRPRGGGNHSRITAADIAVILAFSGDATAGEVTAAFNRRRRGRERIHVSSMKRAFKRYGYVVKKNADGRWRVCAPTCRHGDGRF